MFSRLKMTKSNIFALYLPISTAFLDVATFFLHALGPQNSQKGYRPYLTRTGAFLLLGRTHKNPPLSEKCSVAQPARLSGRLTTQADNENPLHAPTNTLPMPGAEIVDSTSRKGNTDSNPDIPGEKL